MPRRDLTPGSLYMQALEMLEQSWYTMVSVFPQVTIWEVGNEWNLNAFLHPDGFLDSDMSEPFTADEKIRFATDYAFEMPADKVADAQRKFDPDVWMYRYELITKSGVATGWKASHAFELPFVFDKRSGKLHKIKLEILEGRSEKMSDSSQALSLLKGDGLS